MSNFMLIHGSFQGGWIWKLTADRLRRMGHTVYAPTLEGCAERRGQVRRGITITVQAQEIAEMLFFEDLWEVILVGTSTGGLVISKVADLARDHISQLIFVDALAPQPGETVADIVVRNSESDITVRELTKGPSPYYAENGLFTNIDPTLRTWALSRYTFHPTEASDAPGELDGFWKQTWKAKVIRCKLSGNPSEAHQRRTAIKLNAEWHELDSGHYPMLSHPDELADLLQS